MFIEVISIALSISIIVLLIVLFKKLSTIEKITGKFTPDLVDEIKDITNKVKDIGTEKLKAVASLCGKTIADFQIPC